MSKVVKETDEELREEHLITVPMAEYYRNGPAGHHIHSFDVLVTEGIAKIFEVFSRKHVIALKKPRSYGDRKLIEAFLQLEFSNGKLDRPMQGGRPMLPNMAIRSKLRYAGALTASLRITIQPKFSDSTLGEIRTFELNDVSLGNVPIPVGTRNCHTSTMTPDALFKAGEDPYNPGGSFIVDGNEKIIMSMENIAKNMPTFHLQVTDRERVRCEVLSQAGIGFENSSQTKIFFETSGAIILEIVLTLEKTIAVPFYSIFRAFGVQEDRRICEYIIGDLNDQSDLAYYLRSTIYTAFSVTDSEMARELRPMYDFSQVLVYMYNRIHSGSNTSIDGGAEDVIRYKVASSNQMLDERLFPHMGGRNERPNKLMYLGYLIRRMLMVARGIYKPTDRDNFMGKDVYPAGPTLAKSLKSLINLAVIVKFKKALEDAFQQQDYSTISADTIFRSCYKPDSLGDYLRKSLSSGLKEIKISTMNTKNRIHAVQAEHKNQHNILSTLRTVSASEGKSAPTSDRSIQQRSVHNSFPPFLDPMQGIEGSKVGLDKQMSIGCSITMASDPIELRMMLTEQLILLSDLQPSDIHARQLYKVFLNGEWLGCSKDSVALARHFRELRRAGRIHRETSIHVDMVSTGELNFHTSMGRLCYPMFVVYSNAEEYEAAQKSGKDLPFSQWTRFTAEHARQLSLGQIELEPLIREGIIEYITVQEIDNCLVAENLSRLRAHAHDPTIRYSHMVSDAGCYGVLSLSVPFAHQAQPIRSIYETKQIKQALSCGRLNFPWCYDKSIFCQYFSQYPLVGTIGSVFAPPNGMNIIVMIQTDGNNQEDSVTTDRGSKERGLYSGAYFDSYSAVADNGERIGPPPEQDKGRLFNDFSQTEDGIIKLGSVVSTPNAVIVGRFSSSTRSDGNVETIDNSVTYDRVEPGKVTAIFRGHDSQSKHLVQVQIANHREPKEGEKYSARSGNKAVCSRVRDECSSYVLEDGRVPDMVLNPHAMPSRMVLNQLIESVYSEYCARNGIVGDATIFRAMDVNQLVAKCREIGIAVEGSYAYDGMTGRRLSCKIFTFICYYQRLKKFAIDDANVVGISKRSALTGQPVKRISRRGGMKEGQMEIQALSARGAMRTLDNICYQDSDRLVVPVCDRCGTIAAANSYERVYLCPSCETTGLPYRVKLAQSCKATTILYNLINSAGVSMHFDLEPPCFAHPAP